MHPKYVLLVFSFVYLALQAKPTATPLLEQKITLSVTKQPTEKVLKQISEQIGCTFSYSAESINIQSSSTLAVTNKPLKVVLNDMFENKVTYKVRGKYIILKKNKDEAKVQDTKILEGYIYDKRTGTELTNASIYDKKLGVSAITDQYGYFRIEVPQTLSAPSLFVSKAGYSDTLLLSSTLSSTRKMMEVTMNSTDTKRAPESSFSKFLPKWLLPRKIDIHSTNLTDSIFRKVQLSLLPMVNTNALLTGNTKNDFSFNLTVGYVYAIQKCELGAGINIVRTNAGVCQLAGAGNIVGANSYGFQAAGAFNIAHNALGVQCAGALNSVHNNANIQAAGAVNTARKANVQIAGAISMAIDTVGVQTSGAINIVTKQAEVQAAGAVNIAGKAKVQIAGAVNLAKDTAAVQLAGALNLARVAGTQVAAVNIAKHSKTLQLGVINIADSCSGIPVGIFSYVRSGYHHLELSMDEASFVNITFRSGVQHFHTSFSAGILTKNINDELVSFGFGMGTSLGNPRKCLFDIDLSANQFATTNKLLPDAHQFKLYAGIDHKLSKHISLAVGISYNVLTTETASADNELIYSRLVPYTLNNQLVNSTNIRSWVGGKVAFRFM